MRLKTLLWLSMWHTHMLWLWLVLLGDETICFIPLPPCHTHCHIWWATSHVCFNHLAISDSCVSHQQQAMCVMAKNLSVSPNITRLGDMIHAKYTVLHKQCSCISNAVYNKESLSTFKMHIFLMLYSDNSRIKCNLTNVLASVRNWLLPSFL